MIYYDSYNIQHKSPMGAARSGSEISFSVGVKRNIEASFINVVLRGTTVQKTKLELSGQTDDLDIFKGQMPVGNAGLYYYRFEIVKPDGRMIFAGTRDGHTASCGDWLPEWRLAVYESDFETPDDFSGAVMYQIFPDRFFKADGVNTSGARNKRYIHENWCDRPHCHFDYPEYCCNDFFMGNLKGIGQKLDYIKSLGVTHIYLNPIFESAENHRYATSDYMRVDPYLGTNEDFKKLCEDAKSVGIKIILDGVFSHTGDDSKYFNRYRHYGEGGAYNDQASPYYDWYSFSNYPDDYECWWGFKTLPNVNETNPDYMNFITGEDGVISHWMKLGASGWRLDVADELPDEFLQQLRKSVKLQDKNAIIIGEVWENAVTKHSYGAQREFLLGKQCDTVMNYPFLNAVTDYVISTDADTFYNSIMRILNDYPLPSVNCLMNMLSTHDTARILNRLGAVEIPERKFQADAKLTESQRKLGIERLKLAAILQFTLPGVPCIYYGDEAGVEGFGDPSCRATFPWGNENTTLLKLHRQLGIIRNSNKNDFSSVIAFITHENGVVSYKRGDITVTINLSENAIPICGKEILLNTSDDNSVIGSGNAVIQKG